MIMGTIAIQYTHRGMGVTNTTQLHYDGMQTQITFNFISSLTIIIIVTDNVHAHVHKEIKQQNWKHIHHIMSLISVSVTNNFHFFHKLHVYPLMTMMINI